MKLWIVFLVVLKCAGTKATLDVTYYPAQSQFLCQYAAQELEGECRFETMDDARQRADLLLSAQWMTVKGLESACRDGGRAG